MPPELLGKLQRLAAAGIKLLPAQIDTYFVLERGGFCALVERTETGFGRIGSAGLLHEQGFAAVVWRGADPFFVGQGFERAATAEEIAELRSFQSDLSATLA
ncbi:MAG TPA: hypothetical protein VFL57_06485 [Bryobacteraceae bacterium]|nr:hypothetical protein [Bryobacteraceae bacterium]